ncbi:hypothetical protein SERLA73DRAFT_135684, partial [Serpula lacrymans var. lacrymans S7.3]
MSHDASFRNCHFSSNQSLNTDYAVRQSTKTQQTSTRIARPFSVSHSGHCSLTAALLGPFARLSALAGPQPTITAEKRPLKILNTGSTVSRQQVNNQPRNLSLCLVGS